MHLRLRNPWRGSVEAVSEFNSWPELRIYAFCGRFARRAKRPIVFFEEVQSCFSRIDGKRLLVREQPTVVVFHCCLGKSSREAKNVLLLE